MKGLRRWRLRRNLTQEDLADMTDLSQRTVSMIENGRQRPREDARKARGGAGCGNPNPGPQTRRGLRASAQKEDARQNRQGYPRVL